MAKISIPSFSGSNSTCQYNVKHFICYTAAVDDETELRLAMSATYKGGTTIDASINCEANGRDIYVDLYVNGNEVSTRALPNFLADPNNYKLFGGNIPIFVAKLFAMINGEIYKRDKEASRYIEMFIDNVVDAQDKDPLPGAKEKIKPTPSFDKLSPITCPK